jgi:integrase
MLTDTMLKTWRTTAAKTAERDVVVKDATTGKLRTVTKAGDKIPDRKRSDRDGMYATMTDAGTISFRFDYAVKGRRETLTIGRYDATLGARSLRSEGALEFGMALSLAEARLLLARARRDVEQGVSPSRAKVERRSGAADELNFGQWGEKYFAEVMLAASTKTMRRAVYENNLATEFGRLKLEEITPMRLLSRCEAIKARGAPSIAIQAREIVSQVYRFAQARGLKVENPAEAIRPRAIATRKPRERALVTDEIGIFFRALERAPTAPTLRMALRFVFLTLVRKSEFVNATWSEVDRDVAAWTIGKERMKAGRPHIIYLSRQARAILKTLRECYPSSAYLHPSRYSQELPISRATLNKVINTTLATIRAEGGKFDDFSVHDLRRTASTLLHEAGFNSDHIEKCLAHEQGGVRAVYNRAEYADQRRSMLQAWADMVDGWIAVPGEVVPIGKRRKLSAAS